MYSNVLDCSYSEILQKIDLTRICTYIFVSIRNIKQVTEKIL